MLHQLIISAQKQELPVVTAKAVINAIRIAKKTVPKPRSAQKSKRLVAKKAHLQHQLKMASLALMQRRDVAKKVVLLQKLQLKPMTQKRKSKIF